MTGATIRAVLNTRLGKSELADAAVFLSVLNLALQAIATRAHWPDLHKTDSTTLDFTALLKYHALPADFQALDRIFVADDRTIEEMHPDALRALQDQDSPATGEPDYYSIIGGNVYVYPLPDAAVTLSLDHWHVPAAVTAEAGALVFGDEFQEAMICGTIVAYLKATGFNEHPKLAENVAMFDREIALLMPRADTKVTIAKPYRYA